jgi:hypothetical protein
MLMWTQTSALRVATGVTLLAAFLEDQGGLATFGTEIADAFGYGLRWGHLLDLGYPQMLSQDLGNGIRQGANTGATVSQMSPTTDALELSYDFAQALRWRQGRGEA